MTTVNLVVLGLCVVLEPEGESQKVIAVNTAVRGIPKHETFLGFTGVTGSEGVPDIDIDIEYPLADPADTTLVPREPPLIPSGMRFMHVLPCTSIRLPTPTRPSQPLPGEVYKPASIRDLGLGRLREGLGTGDWSRGEGARLELPVKNAARGWQGLVGSFRFPAADSDSFRPVADFFRWRGGYDGECRVAFTAKNGAPGNVSLSGDAEVRLLSFARTEPRGTGRPFTFAVALSQMKLTTGRRFQRPIMEPEMKPLHPESGSCPPHQGP